MKMDISSCQTEEEKLEFIKQLYDASLPRWAKRLSISQPATTQNIEVNKD